MDAGAANLYPAARSAIALRACLSRIPSAVGPGRTLPGFPSQPAGTLVSPPTGIGYNPNISHRRDRKERRVFYGKTLRANFSSSCSNAVYIVRETGASITSFLSVSAISACSVEVADTGRGIATEYLERIFDPFFSMHREGTGLGLAISRKIVENHGGRIEVNSKPGKGTKFGIVLPTARG